jgi:SAM-dependent methyltransferase
LAATNRHEHGDEQDDVDWAAVAEELAVAAGLDAGWYADCAADLAGSDDRLLVDVGCGGAGMVEALALAASEEARLVGLEPTPEVAAVARERMGEAGFGPPLVEIVEAGAADLATYAEPGTVDLVWASGVIHHIGDQQQAIIDLARFLAPGGRFAIAEGGLGPAYIPWDVGVGAPGLMQRLLGANDEWFRRMREGLSGSVRMPAGWAVALRRAGLTDVRSTTLLLDSPAPLAPTERDHVLAVLSGHVEHAGRYLGSDDLEAWKRLLDPADDAWLGVREDLQSLSARTVHVGTAP